MTDKEIEDHNISKINTNKLKTKIKIIKSNKPINNVYKHQLYTLVLKAISLGNRTDSHKLAKEVLKLESI